MKQTVDVQGIEWVAGRIEGTMRSDVIGKRILQPLATTILDRLSIKTAPEAVRIMRRRAQLFDTAAQNARHADRPLIYGLLQGLRRNSRNETT